MLICVKNRQIEDCFIWDINMSGIFVNKKNLSRENKFFFIR